MIRFFEKLHTVWHNYFLLTVYHVLDVYLSNERARTIVGRILLLTFLIVVSLLLYFSFTRWIPGTKHLMDFTSRDTKNIENVSSSAPEMPAEPAPLPVEDTANY